MDRTYISKLHVVRGIMFVATARMETDAMVMGDRAQGWVLIVSCWEVFSLEDFGRRKAVDC